jgi:hypothetical protein
LGKITGGYWADISRRKEFFDAFAKEHGFDPLVAENWYKITSQKIEERKVNYMLLPFC